PEEAPSRAAFDLLTKEFGPGPFAPIVLAVRTTGPVVDPGNLGQLYDYSRRIAGDPRVEHVDSLVDIDPRMTIAQYELLYGAGTTPPDRYVAGILHATTQGDLTAFTVYTPFGPNEATARALVRDLRSPTGPLAAPAGVTVLVGGGAADVEDVV